MDQSEVNEIIVDSDAPPRCKCNEIEKEFVILKGSIKKLILDIREQMNSTENPFSNIQMLQMPPPAPVIKEDPIEFELPKDEEEKKQAENKAKEEADKQAAREKAMAQELKNSKSTECPLTAKAGAAHDRCPLAANVHRPDQGCPLARRSQVPDHSCTTATTTQYYDLINYLYQLLSQCECGEHQTGNVRNDPYHSGLASSGGRHVCATCGKPVSPDVDAYRGSWPYPYPPYPQRGWPERQGRGVYPEASRQPAQSYAGRPYFRDHPEYEPAQYGYPYGPGYADAGGECDPWYRPQNTGGRRVARASPEYYYQDRDDRYYDEQERYESRRPVREDNEPEYYQPAARPRRVYREPADLQEDRYYRPSPDEQRGPVRNRSAPRRRRELYAPTPAYGGADEEFEMTEPIPEIDILPDEPEREEEPLRIRKRARAAGILPEPLRPDLVEQPNPKPRRSRAIKHRS